MGKCISKNKHDSVKSCFLVIFTDIELINYDLFTGPDVICDCNFHFERENCKTTIIINSFLTHFYCWNCVAIGHCYEMKWKIVCFVSTSTPVLHLLSFFKLLQTPPKKDSTDLADGSRAVPKIPASEVVQAVPSTRVLPDPNVEDVPAPTKKEVGVKSVRC